MHSCFINIEISSRTWELVCILQFTLTSFILRLCSIHKKWFLPTLHNQRDTSRSPVMRTKKKKKKNRVFFKFHVNKGGIFHSSKTQNKICTRKKSLSVLKAGPLFCCRLFFCLLFDLRGRARQDTTGWKNVASNRSRQQTFPSGWTSLTNAPWFESVTVRREELGCLAVAVCATCGLPCAHIQLLLITSAAFWRRWFTRDEWRAEAPPFGKKVVQKNNRR